MKKALVRTDFNFPGQKSVYHGKVRDVYNINDDLLVMVATDRSRHLMWFYRKVFLTKDKY